MRTASLIMLSGLFVQVARADEIRHTTFPNVMLGTWAETAEQCAAKDKTNIVIQSAKYRDGGGDCAVRWIVEAARSDGNPVMNSRLNYKITCGGLDRAQRCGGHRCRLRAAKKPPEH